MDLVLEIYTRANTYTVVSHNITQLEQAKNDALEILHMPLVQRVLVRAGRGGEVMFDTDERGETA